MKLKLILIAMCVCGGNALLMGNDAEPKEVATEEVGKTADDNTAQADTASADSQDNKPSCGCTK
jgi:hypothetical protein